MIENDKHGLVRGLILPEIVKNISKEFSVSDDEALDMFYTSATGRSFSDNETGLYGQSVLFITNLFYEEIREKSLRE